MISVHPAFWRLGVLTAATLTLLACKVPVAPVDTGDTDIPTNSIPTAVDDSERLRSALGDSVWHGMAERGGVVRTVEQHFRAGVGQWAEVGNPYGPSWDREFREITIQPDGATVNTIVTIPPGWESNPDAGTQEEWRFEVVPGSPRVLRIEREGIVEAYTEGTAPMPTSGFTATARVWTPGTDVDTAFCDSGIWGFDYDVFFDFARGTGATPMAQDVVTGITLEDWVDSGDNAFAVADVPGFNWGGGTALSDRYNFVVTYRGTIQHPGGPLRVREADDTVSDGVWVFVDGAAGTGGEDDYLFEVHGFYWWDGSGNEPSVSLAPGPVDIEVMIARCTEPVEDVGIEFALGNSGSWIPARQLPTLAPVNGPLNPGPF